MAGDQTPVCLRMAPASHAPPGLAPFSSGASLLLTKTLKVGCKTQVPSVIVVVYIYLVTYLTMKAFFLPQLCYFPQMNLIELC